MQNSTLQKDHQLLISARARGKLALFSAYVRLSGPGWLQSAITLGGGSLAGSLYLGILGGTSLLWVQPLAMILGVIMLSAISYVTLSTGKRPFAAINRHVNPVLGWGWAMATLMANLVWSLPQFSLATAAVRQNLLPGIFGPQTMPENLSKLIVCVSITVVCVIMVWFYDSGSRGIKAFEVILKLMVGVIVVCFFAVVIKLSLAGVLDWNWIARGFIPDIKLLSSPVKTFEPVINEVARRFQGFWKDMIVSQQRDVMITVTATAVGINMTFLLPYSMRKRGWNKDFRGLAIFDLSTGLLIPFVLATACVVIASSAQFHARPATGLLGQTGKMEIATQPTKDIIGKYRKIAQARVKYEIGDDVFAHLSDEQKAAQIETLPAADKRLSAMLVKRDAFDLAQSLSPLTGEVFAHYVFGIGVMGMAISSIIILMLINGFVVCEMLSVASKGWTYRLGCLAPSIGMLAPFIWTGRTQFWLAVPTSVFGMTLLPIAYFSFYLLMNQKGLLGENMPRGVRRAIWNVLMALAAGVAAFCSIWVVWSKARWAGLFVVAAFITLAVIVHLIRHKKLVTGKCVNE